MVRTQVVQIDKRAASTDRWHAYASLAVSAGILGWLVWSCRYGFDFTDEGFYLNWMSRPFSYTESSTQFGFLYHPIYLLLDGDIAALRQLNLIFTYCLAWIAGRTLLGRIFGEQALDALNQGAIAAAIATSAMLSVVFSGMWLPTPSYNTLAFQGLLVTTIGLFLAESSSQRSNQIGWLLIGVGGWLTFMAKPTSAAALAVVSTAYFLISRNFSFKYVAMAVGTALCLLVVAALVIDGSVAAFVMRLQGGALLAKALASGHTLEQIFRLEELTLQQNEKVVLLVVAASVFGAICMASADIQVLRQAFPILSAAIAILGALTVFSFFPMEQIRAEHRGLLMFATPLGAALAGMCAYLISKAPQKSGFRWPLMATLLVLPYVYAFGTGNNYWSFIGLAGIFVVFASLLALAPLASHPRLGVILLVVGFSVQAVSSVMLRQGLAWPYRQPQPLYENDVRVEVGKPGATLVLSDIHARYLSSALNLAEKSGFVRETAMIDLTGHSPGVIYALGARSVGTAWMLGGYPGTREFVSNALKRVPCEQLVSAWLLTEPQGPLPVPLDVLTVLGAELATDYELVGALKSPEGQNQYLYKPKRDLHEALQACKAAISDGQ